MRADSAILFTSSCIRLITDPHTEAGGKYWTMEKIKEVTIYTDGACDPNPGPGGYGAVLIFGHYRKELSGGFRQTTNNRMEIYAVIAGLQALKEPCRVKLFCDSEYVVKAMTEGWAHRWWANNWHRNRKERAANHDLWEKVLSLCSIHQVEFIWVRGHSGIAENERCDQLSMQALRHGNLPIDEGYSNRRQSAQATLFMPADAKKGINNVD